MDRLAAKLTWILLVTLIFLALTISASHHSHEDLSHLERFKRSAFDMPSVYNFSGKHKIKLLIIDYILSPADQLYFDNL